MSQVHVRKIVESQTEYAGRKWWYSFRAIPTRIEEASVARYADSVLQRAAPLTKAWSDDLNSEWVTRTFFAAKMVLGASVMAQSLEYAARKNLRPVVPYLEYYTVLYSLRAVVLTEPGASWNNGEIFRMTHKKTVNVACDIIKGLDPAVAEKLKWEAFDLKDFRELISYRAPSSGDKFKRQETDVFETSRFLLEVAQLQSEMLEVSLQKHATGTYELKGEWMRHACCHEIEGEETPDNEDWYRLDYLRRKYPTPTNIYQMISQGHVEDVFGSWCPEKDEAGDDLFDPDENCRILFDLP